MSLIAHLFGEIEPFITAYGVVAMFVIVYLESFGTPLPGETGLITASLLAAKGDLSVVKLYFAVLFGGILGDSTGYLIGKFGGRKLLQRFGPLVRLTPERLETIEADFRRRGIWLVMIARFLPLLRQLNGVIAGTLAMPWHIFLAANVVGAIAWTSVWVLGPFFFADLFKALR